MFPTDFVCFTCRLAGRVRAPRARNRHRRLAWSLRSRRLGFWSLGKGFRPRLKSHTRSLVRFGLRRPPGGGSQGSVDTVLSPLFFHGWAAGSEATRRRRQEKHLLEGLKDLLANLDSCPSDSEFPSPAHSPRGRSVHTDPSPNGRDVSPGWIQVNYRKKNGKGRVRQGVASGHVPNTPPESKPASILKQPDKPKKVTFQTSESSLLAQLKELIRECDNSGPGNLLSGLQRLVSQFSSASDPSPKGMGRQFHVDEPRGRSGVPGQGSKGVGKSPFAVGFPVKTKVGFPELTRYGGPMGLFHRKLFLIPWIKGRTRLARLRLSLGKKVCSSVPWLTRMVSSLNSLSLLLMCP